MSLSAGFETGTNGNTIATTDAGDADAWDTVSIVSGGTLAYDNSQAAHGGLSAKVASGATSGQCTMRWTTAFPNGSDHYGRCYLYVTANPAVNFRFVLALESGVVGAGVLVLTNGKLRVIDNVGAQGSTTNAIALNQWVRVEFHFIHSATVGQIEIKLFNTADSTTPTETLTTAATLNTLASADEIRFGLLTTAANVGPYWMDALLADEAAYPGPFVASNPYPYIGAGYFPTEG